jgi:hypothetical protein
MASWVSVVSRASWVSRAYGGYATSSVRGCR